MNEEKVQEILSVVENTHHFNEIVRELNWSKNTVSKYINNLQERDLIYKDLTEEGRAGYFLTQEGRMYVDMGKIFTTSLPTLKRNINSLKELRELGLFNNGLNTQGVKEFLDIETFNIKNLLTLSNKLNWLFKDKNPEVEVDIKVHADPEELLEELEDKKEKEENKVS